MVVFVNKAKMVEDSHEIQIIVSGLYSFILRKFLNERIIPRSISGIVK